MKNVLPYIVIALVLGAGFYIGFCTGKHRTGTPDVPEVQRDTVWVHDTLRIPAPKPKIVHVVDTAYVPVPDTVLVHHHDTAYVPVPISQAYYSAEEYEAWVSGYRPKLDSLHLNQKTAYIEVPVVKTVTKKTHWGIGIQAGATYMKDAGIVPYVGIGVSYNPLTF